MSRWRFAIIIFSFYFALLLVGRWVKCGYNRSDLLFLSFLLACVIFSFKSEIDNSNTMGWTSYYNKLLLLQAWVAALFLLPPRQNVAEYQNLPESSCRFRSILLYACETKSWFVSYVVEKDACAYHCATDGMLMALKRWNNTNNESKLNILIKNADSLCNIVHCSIHGVSTTMPRLCIVVLTTV